MCSSLLGTHTSQRSGDHTELLANLELPLSYQLVCAAAHSFWAEKDVTLQVFATIPPGSIMTKCKEYDLDQTAMRKHKTYKKIGERVVTIDTLSK